MAIQHIFGTMFPHLKNKNNAYKDTMFAPADVPENPVYNIEPEPKMPTPVGRGLYSNDLGAEAPPPTFNKPNTFNYGFGRIADEDGVIPPSETPWQPDNNVASINPNPNQPTKPMNADDIARKEYEDAVSAGKPKVNPWLNAAYMAAQIMNRVFNPQDQTPIMTGGEQARQNKIDRAYQKLAPLQALRDKDLAEEFRKKQMQNMDEDNRRQREYDEANRQYRYDKLKSDAELKRNAQQDANLRAFNRLKYFDPNNPAHVAQAKAAGMETEKLIGWDDRNPITKMVAGTLYKYNQQTDSFEPTDVKDQSKGLVDFTVTDSEGRTHTYKVSEEKAASFENQQSMLGKRVELAKALQATQHAFTASENEKNRNLRRDYINNQKSQFTQLMELRRQALINKNEAEVKRLDAMRDAAKARALSAGLGEDVIKEIFGEN